MTRGNGFPIIPSMPKKKPAPGMDAPAEDEVKLKSFLGIRPGVYLACLYGAALLIILFFILLYPGIKNPGSVLVVNSEPAGAAVLVDGVYMDASPCEVFVKQGRRHIELKLPGFLSAQTEIDIDGRLFASAIFPRKLPFTEKLSSPSPAEAFGDYAAEYAAWTFAGEPSAIYQIPLSLSEGAYRLGPGAADPAVRESMNDTIAAAARYAVTRAALRDLIRAKTLLDNNGLSPSPIGLLASAGDVIDYFGGNPQAALWLGATLNGEALSTLAGSEWYMEAAGENTSSLTMEAGGQGGRSTIDAGQMVFREVPGGLSFHSPNFPAGAGLGAFFISEGPISVEAWEQFLAQRPVWKSENIDALMSGGLVSEEYLGSSGLSGAPAGAVAGISWHAAKAFCEWLSASLPPQYRSWEARLPTEAEWEYAAKSSLDYDRGYGHFWEWCEDPYAPLGFLPAPAAIASPERALRGGSWANPPKSTGMETRGSLPPSFCSPFVSARPVIAPKRTAGE